MLRWPRDQGQLGKPSSVCPHVHSPSWGHPPSHQPPIGRRAEREAHPQALPAGRSRWVASRTCPGWPSPRCGQGIGSSPRPSGRGWSWPRHCQPRGSARSLWFPTACHTCGRDASPDPRAVPSASCHTPGDTWPPARPAAGPRGGQMPLFLLPGLPGGRGCRKGRSTSALAPGH